MLILFCQIKNVQAIESCEFRSSNDIVLSVKWISDKSVLNSSASKIPFQVGKCDEPKYSTQNIFHK